MHGGQEQDMCKPYHLMWSGRRVLRRKGSSIRRPIILLEMLALYCIVPNRSRCCDVVRALPSPRVRVFRSYFFMSSTDPYLLIEQCGSKYGRLIYVITEHIP